MAPFVLTFLIYAATPGYVLISEDLELGASDEREHAMLVFLGLGHLIKMIFPNKVLIYIFDRLFFKYWVSLSP